MPLPLLHTLTGCLIILCFAGKLVMHDYLDRMHGRVFGFVYALLNPLPYFLPYRSMVDDKYLSLKKYCNTLLWVASVSLILNLTIGLFIYFA